MSTTGHYVGFLPKKVAYLFDKVRKERWYRYAGEAVATIGMYVFAFGIHLFVSPLPLTFIEQDPGLSYPLVRPETVPIETLFAISISVPSAFILIGHIAHAIRRHRGGSTETFRSIFHSFLWCGLGLFQALAIVFSITNLLKMLAGRQRPNFFALCDYEGYKDAIVKGDLHKYQELTAFNAIGDISKCRASFSDVAESMRSFPSGHSSISFSGMVYASLYLRASLGVAQGVHISINAIISSLPLIVSAYIAISRVRDRWHNTDDIVIGAAIGILSGALAWRHYVTLRREGHAPTSGAGHLEVKGTRPNPALLAIDTAAAGSGVIGSTGASPSSTVGDRTPASCIASPMSIAGGEPMTLTSNVKANKRAMLPRDSLNGDVEMPPFPRNNVDVTASLSPTGLVASPPSDTSPTLSTADDDNSSGPQSGAVRSTAAK